MAKKDIEKYQFQKGRSSSEAAAAGRLGGIASGKARSFKSLAREMLTEEEKRAMIKAQAQKAKRGDTNAFKMCMEIGDIADEASAADDALSLALEALARGMTDDSN